VILKYATRQHLIGLLEEMGLERKLYGPRKLGDEWRLAPVAAEQIEIGPARTSSRLKRRCSSRAKTWADCSTAMSNAQRPRARL